MSSTPWCAVLRLLCRQFFSAHTEGGPIGGLLSAVLLICTASYLELLDFSILLAANMGSFRLAAASFGFFTFDVLFVSFRLTFPLSC